MSLSHAAWIVLATVGAAPADQTRTWNFENDPVGAIAPGFAGEVGRWLVVSPENQNHALLQAASSAGPVFNVALVKEAKASNLELSVRLRAVAGKEDQGGGLVWRAHDARNYYLARFNPLEDNFRVYKVVDGERTQLGSVDVKRPEGWHKLTVRMAADHIVCTLDRTTRLDVHDSTFPGAGMIGLWTKSDARTQFDDLSIKEVTDTASR
jgi:hypothetical protein